MKTFWRARRRGLKRRLATAVLALGLFPALGFAGVCSGKVTDAVSNQPVRGALVTAGDRVVRTDASGAFQIPDTTGPLGARAYGYQRTRIPAGDCATGDAEVKLTPFQPKALYLSFYAIGTPSLRNKALELIQKTELNALVIDVKGDRGMVAFHSSNPLAAAVGAQSVITIPNLQGRVAELHQLGL